MGNEGEGGVSDALRTKEETEVKDGPCNRCGQCCHWLDRVSGKKVKCKYLVVHGKKTSCRVYTNRLGRKIGFDGCNDVYCVLRSSPFILQRNFPGCPQNEMMNDG